MKYWIRALRELENSEKSMKSIYNVICSFKENVFFEKLVGGHIEKTTYAEFDDKTRAAATVISRAVQQQNVANTKEGRFIGIELNNSPEWVIGFWAILMAGYRPVLLNTRLPSDQVERIIKDTDAVLVLTETAKRPIDFEVAGISGSALCGEERSDLNSFADGFALSTSGTSGLPKIFLYDGSAMSAQIFNSQYVLKQNPTIKTYYKGQIKQLAFLPFYHIFGLVATLMWFSFFGRTFVFLNDLKPETIQYACKRHGVTHLFAIPLVFNGVAAHVVRQAKKEGEKQEKRLNSALKFSIKLQSVFPRLGRYIASKFIFKSVREKIFGNSVKFCISGGGYLRDDALTVFNGLGYSLYNGYGMTEIGIASVELRMSAGKRVLGSVGKPFPSVEYTLSDEGVLLVRGDSIHSAQIINGETVLRDKQEFFNTNDVFFDNDDHYYIRGRSDDMIISDNGEIIVPDLIERNFDLPYAKSFSVLGISDKKTEIALVIYPNPLSPPSQIDQTLVTANEVIKRLPIAERITRVYLSHEPLPLALESKIQRGLLKKMIEKGQLSCEIVDMKRYDNIEEISDENYKKVLSGVCDIFKTLLTLKDSDVTPHSNFILDLGGSSLEYFSLLEELSKKFNVSFKLEDTFLATPRDFAEYILRA